MAYMSGIESYFSVPATVEIEAYLVSGFIINMLIQNLKKRPIAKPGRSHTDRETLDCSSVTLVNTSYFLSTTTE